jgi:hypothetical protein
MILNSTTKAIFLLLSLVVGIVGCKKDSNLILSPSELGIGSYLKLDASANRNINYADINNTTVSITVSGVGEEADSVVVYVSTNNTTSMSTWRRVKAFKTTDNKAVLNVKATEIAAALGIAPTALTPGRQYILFNEVVTKSGRRFSLQNTNAEFESSADYAMGLRWATTVICPFVPANTNGTYTITRDPWDGAVGETAVVTTTANTVTITYLYPYATPDPGFAAVTINVDPATGAATMPKQTYGGYGPGFQNFSGQGTGFVFSCTGTITLNVTHTLGGASYGTYPITLVK